MKHRLGLRAKFILIIVIGLSLVFVAVAIVVTRVTTNNLKNSLVDGSKSFASLATQPIGESYNIYKDSGRVRITQQVEKFTQLDNNIENVAVVDVNGNLLYIQNEDPGFSFKTENAASFEPVYEYDGTKLSRIVYPYLENFGAHRYSVIYTVSYDAIEESIAQLQKGILFVAASALVTTILIAYLLISRMFINPLSEVSEEATKISKGDLGIVIESKGRDEIGDLANSVNSMAETLKADIRKLREMDKIKSEFMMIASHNLRTPITIIQGYLDTLLMSKELPSNLKDTVEVVAASGNRLQIFAEDILTVSRLEAGENVTGQRDRTDIKELLSKIAKDFTPLAKEKKLVFETLLTDQNCFSDISTPHIRGAIWNILDNALKFTKEGKITLELNIVDAMALITVRDTGVGIDKEEIPKLFTKFHRGTSTEQYDYEGTGIGLYLTKLIVEQHKGTIRIDSAVNKGTSVTISLPTEEKANTSI